MFFLCDDFINYFSLKTSGSPTAVSYLSEALDFSIILNFLSKVFFSFESFINANDQLSDFKIEGFF